MDLISSPKWQKIDDLEVTGISRSGRVRKKSSKLMGYESSDEVADKQKRQKSQQSQKLIDRYDTPGPSGYHTPKDKKSSIPRSGSRDIEADPEPESSATETGSSEYDSEDVVVPNREESLGTASESADDNYDHALTIDERGGDKYTKLEPLEQEISSQANSLYMLEKCKKKIIIKGGKIIGGAKTQRKDKGKARFTAYMLWAKEIRQKLVVQCPDMDFATISKRLGELWSTVPNLEKCNWRRRAKRLVFNPNSKPALRNEPVWKIPTPALSNKFINKIRNVKEQKASITKKTKKHGASSLVKNLSFSSSSTRAGRANESIIEKESKCIVGTRPIDVAAHLTLLGESLTVIGQLLTNHDGKIAISGSLSVLLDSLLCALGPLICLTQQVPEVNSVNPEILSKMLDNLAYIMPGL